MAGSSWSTATFDFSTTIARPFALVASGGQVPGHRPRTVMAFIKRTRTTRDGVVQYVAHTYRAGRWSKRPGYFLEHEIFKRWQAYPNARALAAARKALPKSNYLARQSAGG